MLTKEQILVFNSKGYDIAFERKGKTYAIKSSSIDSWNEEKKMKFKQETGLDLALIEDEWIFYNPAQYKICVNALKYISEDKKPEQPINYKSYAYLFIEWEGKSLDLSHWDVSNGNDFMYMFYNCRNLQFLDLSGWDVSSSSNFTRMFFNCEHLQALDLSHWDVSKGKRFESMFYGCERLKSLNLASWDTSASDLSFMFYGCKELKSLNLSGWNTSDSDLSFMLYGCKSLESLDLSDWKVNANTDCQSMFENSGIAKINYSIKDKLAKLLQQGRWSEVKQGGVQDSLQKAELF